VSKTLTKQELKQPDEFQHWGQAAFDFAQKNVALVIAAVLVPLVAVGAVFAMNQQRDQREVEAAAKLYEGEAKAFPDKGVAGFRIPGLSDGKPEDVKAAIATFEQVAQTYPGTKAERRAHLLAGDASLQLKDYDAAAKHYEQAVGGTTMEQYYALSGRAHALEAKEAWDDAAAGYKKIVDDPSLVNRDIATMDLARVYAASGKVDLAKDVLAKFGTDFPNSALKSSSEQKLAELGGAPAPAASSTAAAGPTAGVN